MKKEIKKELKSKTFWIYIGGMVLSLSFFLIPSTTFKIFGLIGFIISQLIYLLKKAENKAFKVFSWIYLFIFSFFLIIYVSMKVGEMEITIIAILIIFIGIVLGTPFLYLSSLIKSKKVGGIIISYLGLTLSIILLFSFAFMIIGSNEENKITDYTGKNVEGTWEYISFSALNFYSVNFGEMPKGFSKLISFIEIMISFIIHIIILGRVINSLKEEKNNF